jgi:hypothetical protein
MQTWEVWQSVFPQSVPSGDALAVHPIAESQMPTTHGSFEGQLTAECTQPTPSMHVSSVHAFVSEQSCAAPTHTPF